MPPPLDGNEHLPFVDLIKLKKIDDVTYQSIALPFSPGGELRRKKKRSYGGHVYAQAAWAACHTVESGFLLHNAVGSFHIGGEVSIPFTYKVQNLRNGRSFCTRLVHVSQNDNGNGNDNNHDPEICFTGLISFKRPETNHLDVQERLNLYTTYASALSNQPPTTFPRVPGMDCPWYLRLRAETNSADHFPGLEDRQVDMQAYNASRHPLDRRTLIFYRVTGALPREDPNLHRCAHLYASDRNSLFHVANHLDVGELYTQMSSLVHTTAFHSEGEKVLFGPSETDATPMDDVGPEGRWFALEDWFTRVSCGRARFEGRLWAADGTHVATVVQDGLLRYTEKAEATADEIAALRDVRSKWKEREKL